MEENHKFHYVTVGDIPNLSEKHPSIAESFPPHTFSRLLDCPDSWDDFPCFFYMTRDDSILSSYAVLPDLCYTDHGALYKWAWVGALFTPPERRGKGYGTELIKYTVRVLHEKNIGRGSVFSSRVTLHIYTKLGSVQILGAADRYILMKRIEPYLEYNQKFRSLKSIAAPLYASFIKNYLKFRVKTKKQDDVYVETIEDFSDDYSSKLTFPNQYMEKYHFNDSVEKVLWKLRNLTKGENEDTKLFIIRDDHSREPLGYFILKSRYLDDFKGKFKNLRVCTFMDFGLFKQDISILILIIQRALYEFSNQNDDVFELVTSSYAMKKLARRYGLIKVGSGMSFTISIPPSWKISPEITNIDNWHLTHFCGDGFSFM